MLWQLQNHPVGTSRRINVDSLSILRQYIKDEILTNFHFISTYFFASQIFFDVALLVKKSTLLPRTLFDVISMVEQSTLFPRTFCNMISMVKKPMLFQPSFFGVISLIKKIHVVSTYFF